MGSDDSKLSRYDLSGYFALGMPEIRRIGQKDYAFQKYQGKHSQEYTVMELENGIPHGKAQLFKKGVLQLSWQMNNGDREGEFTIYRDGVIERVMRWSDLMSNADTIVSIVNDCSGKRLLEEEDGRSGIITYRGEFNHEYEHHGFGIVYDERTGIEKCTGYFINGSLVHLHQEFECIGVLRLHRHRKGCPSLLKCGEQCPLEAVSKQKGGGDDDDDFCSGYGNEEEDDYNEWSDEGYDDNNNDDDDDDDILDCCIYNYNHCNQTHNYNHRINRINRNDNRRYTYRRFGGKLFKMQMIEYDGEKEEDNVNNIFDLCPIYIGGYSFNKHTFSFVRHGVGKVLRRESGVCDWISKWKNGEHIKTNTHILSQGWYHAEISEYCEENNQTESKRNPSFRKSWLEKEAKEMDKPVVICNSFNIIKYYGLEEFVIADNMWNERSQVIGQMMELKLVEMPFLKQINIGSTCFQYIRLFQLKDLESLEKVVIGSNSFRIYGVWGVNKVNLLRQPDGLCSISNCPQLKAIRIQDNSFCDFKSFELSNVDALETIEFGKDCFWFGDLFLKSK